jgi:hypothetical protein
MAAVSTMIAGAALGVGVHGAIQGGKAAKAAGAANAAQQAAAMAFQKGMRKKQLRAITKHQKGATQQILASSKRSRATTLEKLASRGWDPGGGVGLSAMRSGARDETNALSQLASQMAAQRASVYGGQEFPMIQHDAGAGASGGYALMGSALGYMAANWDDPSKIPATNQAIPDYLKHMTPYHDPQVA